MLWTGLTASQYRVYMRTLATGYVMKTTVQLLTPEHEVVRTVSHVLMDGQVDVILPKSENGDIPVSRICTLQFLDPDQTLALDSASPTDGAYFMDRMVRVVVSVLCPFGWVDVPVFTGPIVDVDRDGDLVDVECQGKEWYAKQSAWSVFTVKGRRDDVMRSLLYRVGESARYMDLPDSKAIAKVAVGRESQLWTHVWRINSAMNRILFYDARGVCQSRPKPTKTAVVLREGDGEFIHRPTQVNYSTENLVTDVRVQGSRPKKGKPIPVATASAPANHPLALQRRGKRIRKGMFLSNPDAKSTAACRAIAVAELEDGLMQHVEATVDIKPIYHLEPWDIVQIATKRLSVRTRPRSFTIPLVQRAGQGTPMTVGYTQNVKRPRRKRRVA